MGAFPVIICFVQFGIRLVQLQTILVIPPWVVMLVVVAILVALVVLEVVVMLVVLVLRVVVVLLVALDEVAVVPDEVQKTSIFLLLPNPKISRRRR